MSSYSEKQLANARRTIYRAELWRQENPTAWFFIACHALSLERQQQPIAAQSLIESVRKKSFVDKFGNGTRTNNSYASVFIRWLWIEYPSMRHLIELRRCPVGEVMGV